MDKYKSRMASKGIAIRRIGQISVIAIKIYSPVKSSYSLSFTIIIAFD